MFYENCIYQLGYVVDDNQVGPGVPKAEVSFVINSTELAYPAHREGKNTGSKLGIL